MSRFFAAIAILLFVQVVFAAEPGATVLQPTTGGDASKGVTVLSPNGAAPAGGCTTGNCGANTATNTATNSAPIAPPPAGMKAAIVLHAKADCGCQAEPNCACAPKVEYVEPELKLQNQQCGCSSNPTDCSCKTQSTESVAPEQSPNHVEPEIKEKLEHPPACTGEACPKQPEFVQPELKPDCSCVDTSSPCNCAALKTNF